MSYVFISYSKQNKAYVDQLADFLKQQGFDIWIDKDSIGPGERWWPAIKKGIKNCSAFIPVMTPESEKSEWVERECFIASKYNKQQFPILLEGEVGDLYINIQYYDCSNGSMPDEQFIKRLSGFVTQQTKGEDKSDLKSEISVKPIKSSAKNSAESIRAIIGEPFEWCEVPAGEFIYGEIRDKLSLPTFYIAKYPVTYSQYEKFLVADDGYNDLKWWEGLAKIEDPIPEQQWKFDNHPRENINWYQSIAFCRWLSHNLGGNFGVKDAHSWLVRLPTSLEWEKAAAGTSGLIYPYGNEFDPSKGNSQEANKKQTTSVTQYPQGMSPYGVQDMFGNINEWCINVFNELEILIDKSNLYSPRHTKSGMYYYSCNNLKNYEKKGQQPLNGWEIGFRIACSRIE